MCQICCLTFKLLNILDHCKSTEQLKWKSRACRMSATEFGNARHSRSARIGGSCMHPYSARYAQVVATVSETITDPRSPGRAVATVTAQNVSTGSGTA